MKIKETNYTGILKPTNKQPYKDLQCTLYYDSNRKRYWASAMPCAFGSLGMECQPFNGKSEIVLTVENRRSSKTDAAAIAIFDAAQERYKELFSPASPVQETA